MRMFRLKRYSDTRVSGIARTGSKSYMRAPCKRWYARTQGRTRSNGSKTGVWAVRGRGSAVALLGEKRHALWSPGRCTAALKACVGTPYLCRCSVALA
eukprot:6202248-Pleurochrysis_carterae.AAC.1